MKMKLDHRTLKSLKPRDKPYDVWDTDRSAPPSFVARVMTTGEISFILYRRFPGSSAPVRRALGHFGEMSLAEARELARDWIKEIKQGRDPSRAEKAREQAAIEAERIRKVNTVEAALKAYFLHKSDLRTIRSREVEMRRELAAWMDRSLLDIHERDVMALVNAIKARGAKSQARAIYAMVKAFFAWVVDCRSYGLSVSPCVSIKTVAFVGKNKIVNRHLEDYEIAAYWRASDKLGYPLGPYFKLLLLTGLRRVEAAEASWPEFNLSEKRWIIEGKRMKHTKPDEELRDHLVPVTPDIMKLLETLPRHASGNFLFSFKNGNSPISSFSKAKDALDAAMKAELAKEGHTFKPFVIHDVRRTARTRFSSLGISDGICERLLAHTQRELEQRYNKYAFESEKRAALESWHAKLRTIIEPEPAPATGNVVKLRA